MLEVSPPAKVLVVIEEWKSSVHTLFPGLLNITSMNYPKNACGLSQRHQSNDCILVAL